MLFWHSMKESQDSELRAVNGRLQETQARLQKWEETTGGQLKIIGEPRLTNTTEMKKLDIAETEWLKAPLPP